MPKSLFAVAAMSAVAGAAQAQSSVTVYGIMDVGYYGTNTSVTNQSGVQTKAQTSRITNGNEDTSRLGFKGTEDLGGGSSAFFTVEMGLTPANSNLTGASTNTAGSAYENTSNKAGAVVDNRQSFVGLKKNGIGEFALGRQYTNAYAAQSATSPTGNATQVGSVLYPQNGSSSSGTNNDAAMTLRASNAIKAQSAAFAGFRVNGMYVLNNANATQTATVGTGNTNWNGWGLGADYTWNKLFVTYQYQSFKTQYTTGVASSADALNNGMQATASTSIAAGASSVAMWNPQNVSDKQQYAGATYDFGILKAYAGWTGRKVYNSTNGVEQVNRTAQQIGVRSYITPVIETWAAIGNGKVKDTTTATASFSAWQLGGNYYLSKRTNVYAIYGQSIASNISSSTTISAASQNGYSLGLRHTF